nr:AraC family transcriptional regulator [Cupriavidus sp. 2SB]
MDPLSEICSAMRVRSAILTRVQARAPWGVRSGSKGTIKFAVLVEGSCVVATSATPSPLCLRTGDVFIALDDTPYDTYDQPGSALLDCSSMLPHRSGEDLVIGGEGASCHFVCGCFEIDAHEAVPLLSVLPSVLVLDGGRDASLTVAKLLGLLLRETVRTEIGSEAMISRLFELLFIHVVRAYCDQQSLPQTGWLAITVDPHLKHAARAMHSDLGRDWTLELLAQVSGMSRSAFAVRFKEKAGLTPYEYLIRWRMFKAVLLLQRSELSLHAIAHSIGYKSERTFNRVFKRELGTTPGRLKREHQRSVPSTVIRSAVQHELLQRNRSTIRL